MKKPRSVCVLGRGKAGLALAAAMVTLAAPAAAQFTPEDMPGTQGAPAQAAQPDEPEEVIVDVAPSVEQLPVLLIVAKTPADEALASAVRAEVELTGLFTSPTPRTLGLGNGLPEPSRWPPLTTAAVEVGRESRGTAFPMVSSETHHRSMKDTVRRRELVEYPGSEAMTVPVLTDAIIEDVLGTRSHMSGRLVMTDASVRGERSVRMLSADGRRGRRISGFGSLARGADFRNADIWYAAEDVSGKLQLFKEGQVSPMPLHLPGYVQSVGFSPNGQHIVLSMGEGARVQTWKGQELDQMQRVQLPEGKTSLSPSIDNAGRVVHVVGPEKGPFSVLVDDKAVTPPGVWAAMPSFCSTIIDDRVVYMVRSGRSWDIRITSLRNGASRTVASNGMSPACSPDGRTIAFYSPGQYGKGPGVYLVGDMGGRAHKIWDGDAAALRWAPGEPLPARIERTLTPPTAAPPEPEQPQTVVEPPETGAEVVEP